LAAVIIVLVVVVAGVAAYLASRGGKTTTTTAPAAATPTTTAPTAATPTQTTTTPTATTPATTTTPQTTTPAATTTAAKASTIIIGTTDKVTDLDPANAYDFFTWEVLSNVIDTLVKYKPGTDQIVPAIAESWEVKDNGTVWIFHLRKDVRFCDGTPVTAQDVVRSIKRVMRINGDPAWLVTSFVKDVKALDNYTVEFILKHPTGFFLALLATPPYAVVSPKYPPDKIVSDATWGGAGPYCIKEFKRDEYLVLEANPYYYGEKPKTQRIIIRFYKDATTLRLALENGQLDLLQHRFLRLVGEIDSSIVDGIVKTV
jgi:peptide/nickel transport system substrate-binding protein